MRIQQAVLCLAVLFFAKGITAMADDRPSAQAAAAPDYAFVIDKLKSAIRYEVEQKRLPAFSISLVDDDQVIWAEGFGFQDANRQVPATAETVYRVGSVSKLFTDIAVMQLVEERKLDLDAPVQKYLPEFQPRNPFGIPITLRRLMSHRSGLVRESPVGNYFDPDEPSLAATVASLNQTSLVYKPDMKTKYSNAAIAVVGAVLEGQLDVSHPERVRRMILDPLKMTDSSFVVTSAVKPKLATGWMRTYDGRRFEAPTFLLGTGPAGNLYSNVLDLSKFLVCMFHQGKTETGRILKPTTFRQMTTALKGPDGKPLEFGLGFHVQDLDRPQKDRARRRGVWVLHATGSLAGTASRRGCGLVLGRQQRRRSPARGFRPAIDDRCEGQQAVAQIPHDRSHSTDAGERLDRHVPGSGWQAVYANQRTGRQRLHAPRRVPLRSPRRSG